MSSDELPAVVAIPWREYEHEPNPRLKLWGLCEVYEILVRFGVMLELAELRALPDGESRLGAAIATVGPVIEAPTLAAWLGLLTELNGRLVRTDPLVLPELPPVAAALAALSQPAGAALSWDNSLLHLRNTLAHGGAVTTPMAERLLAGWDVRIREIIARLDFLTRCRLVWWADGDARRIAPDGRLGDSAPLSADLRATLTAARLDSRVLLVRDGRCLDLWPLCDFAPTSMSAFGTRTTSSAPAPQVYFRAEKRRLLYAALGCDLPVHQSADHLAAFRAFFRLDVKSDTLHAAAGFATDIAGEAAAVCGRVEQLATLKAAVKGTASGVLWVSGPGGIGKSYLIAKFAQDWAGSNQFIPVFWRFRAGDADRCNRHAFFRHAVRTLSDPKFGLRAAAVFPSLDPSQLLPQFLDLLRDANVRNDKRQVLFILDGLDEIARSDADFVRSIPDWHFGHAVWVCAGRHEGEVVPEVFADGRCRHVFPGGLPGLTPAEIRELIDARVGRRLRELLRHDEDAGDGVRNKLVDAIADRAAGLPLYVHFVCEDLLSGQLPFDGTLPSRLPNKLEDYFEKLLKEAEADDEDAIPSPLIAVYAWALQPLDEDTLFELLVRREVLDREDEAYSRDRLRRVLDRLGTILRPVPRPDGRVGYEPYHLTFRDHIREDRGDRRRIQNRKAREVFCRMTTDWQRLPSGGEARRYVLRHGSEHLLREKRWDELAAVARDEAFLTAQRNELPTDPAAAIRTLQHALTAAGEQDSGLKMAEAVLRLADRYEQLRQASPLELLRAGNLEGAMALADLQDPKRRVLWYLLIAIVLRKTDTVACTLLLRRLIDSAVLKLGTGDDYTLHWDRWYLEAEDPDGWIGPVAVSILAAIADVALAQDAAKWLGLLSPQNQVRLLHELTSPPKPACSLGEACDAWSIAVLAIESYVRPADRAFFLSRLATAQARTGNTRGALRQVEHIADPYFHSTTLCAIAEAQLGEGDVPEALATALRARTVTLTLTPGINQVLVLAQLATLLVRTGNPAGAAEAIRHAESTLPACKRPDERISAIGAIASAHALAGDRTAAIQSAMSISESGPRARRLALLAVDLFKAGDIAGAAETVQQAFGAIESILGDREIVQALCQVACAQFHIGDASGVRNTIVRAEHIAHDCEFQTDRGAMLSDIVAAHSAVGSVDAAVRTAVQLPKAGLVRRALSDIVTARVRVGDFAGALLTAKRIDWRIGDEILKIVRSQAELGLFSAALETSATIDEPAIRASALGEVARSQADAGDICGASATLILAVTVANTVPNWSARAAVLGDLVACRSLVGEPVAIDSLAQLLQSSAIRSESSERELALASIAAAVPSQAAGPAVSGREVERTDAGWTTTPLDRESALAEVARISNSAQRAYRLASFATAQAYAGDRTGADHTFQVAEQQLATLANEHKKSTEYSKIAEWRLRAGFPAPALELTRRILVDTEQHYPRLAELLAQHQAVSEFKLYLHLAERDIRTAIHACGQLARLYPADATAIAELLLALQRSAKQ